MLGLVTAQSLFFSAVDFQTMDTSTCESDFDDGTRRTPANRYSGRVGGRGDQVQSGDISEKLCILADALEVSFCIC